MAVLGFDDAGKTANTGEVLGPITFGIELGEVVAVLGTRPSDVVTVLDLTLGLCKPDSGSVLVSGRDPGDAVRTGVTGLLSRRCGLMPEVSVAELLTVATALSAHPLAIAEIVRRGELGSLLSRRTETLSDGEAQLVRFGLAIADNPQLLVLDHPMSGMDSAARDRFRGQLEAEIASGRTILLAPEDISEVEGIATRYLILRDGRLAEDVTAGDLAARASTRRMSFRAAGADLELISALPFVVSATVDGDVFRLGSTDTGATMAALSAAGITVRGLELGTSDLLATEGAAR